MAANHCKAFNKFDCGLDPRNAGILINFNRRVDPGDEVFGADVAHGAAQQPEGAAEQSHVAKVERSLEQPVHSAEQRNLHINTLKLLLQFSSINKYRLWDKYNIYRQYVDTV